MKWYLASRQSNKSMIEDTIHILKENNQEVICDWTKLNIKKYDESSSLFAKEIIDKLEQVDIFVLISDPKGTDMFVEFGAALAYKTVRPLIRIYIVGKYNKRSLMHNHPDVIHLMKVEDVLKKENVCR